MPVYLEVSPGKILQHLHVWMLEKLLQTVLIHLYGGDILLLFHVDVSDVQPHVAEVSRGLPYL